MSSQLDGVEGTVLHDDGHSEIKRIVIQPESETLPHSHHVSSGHTFVVQGTIEVKTYDFNSRRFMRTEVHNAGDCCKETPDIIHIVKCISNEPAIFVNVTTPPLRDTMVFYDKSELLK